MCVILFLTPLLCESLLFLCSNDTAACFRASSQTRLVCVFVSTRGIDQIEQQGGIALSCQRILTLKKSPVFLGIQLAKAEKVLKSPVFICSVQSFNREIK